MPAKKGKKKTGGKGGKATAAGGKKAGGGSTGAAGGTRPSKVSVAESAQGSMGTDTSGNVISMNEFWTALLNPSSADLGPPEAQTAPAAAAAADATTEETGAGTGAEGVEDGAGESGADGEKDGVEDGSTEGGQGEGGEGVKEEENRVKEWYGRAEEYWASTESSVNGMLGGLGELDAVDVAGSNAFLDSLNLDSGGHSGKGWVIADCGAGIGRVTRHLLARRAVEMVLVEQHGPFLDQAKEGFLGSSVADKVSEYVPLGLQDWTPAAGKFDLIWVQWVANYLTDTDLVAFLKRAAEGLTPKGVICFKENTTNDAGQFVYDHEDSSVTRSDGHFRACFAEAGLLLKSARLQTRFPTDLFPVRMYALVPADQAAKLAEAAAAAEAALLNSL